MTVNSRDGRTRLRMNSIALLPGLATMYPAFLLASTFGAKIAAMSGNPVWLAPAVVVGLLGVAWLAFGVLARRGHQSIQDLADRIERRIAEVTSTKVQSPSLDEDRGVRDKS